MFEVETEGEREEGARTSASTPNNQGGVSEIISNSK
jgi:hypothetical protein